MDPWFIKSPGRLQREIAELNAAGIPHVVDDALKDAGSIHITLQLPHDGVNYEIIAGFPLTYPYSPFSLFSSDIPDGVHKGAYKSLICFLHDVDMTWSTSDTLASMLENKVKNVIDIHLGKTEESASESPDPNPSAAHINYEVNQAVLIPALEIPGGNNYGYATLSYAKGGDLNTNLRGHVMAIMTEDRKKILCKTGADFPGLLAQEARSQLPIRWVRLVSPPLCSEGIDILNEAVKRWPALEMPVFNGGPDIVALIFQDDGEESWVFVRRVKVKSRSPQTQYLIHNIRSDYIDLTNLGCCA